MFQTTANQYIPSKSVAIKPEVVSAVSPSDEIRIHIPSFVGFLAPEQTKFKCVIKMLNARGQIVPDPKAGGLHSLFRQALYRDGNNHTTLELNEDYNAWKSCLNHFTKSPSVLHKDELFAGVQDVVSEPASGKTLYYEELAVTVGASAGAPDIRVRKPHKVMVQSQLHSGIWSQGNIIPVSAMNGMRISLQTDDFLRSCCLVDLYGEKNHHALGEIKLTTAQKTAASEVRTAGDDAASEGYSLMSDINFAANPFAVNDILYIADTAGSNAGEESLGSIIGFYQLAELLGIVYTSLRDTGAGLASLHAIGSVLYYKAADREVAGSFYTKGNFTNAKDGSYLAPSYELSDIEMICQTVQPPVGYVTEMLKAASSSQGISFDIMSYELYRHNQSNTTGLMQAQIPTLMKRAKALFTQPLPTATTSARSIVSHSLTGVADNAQSYEYIHGVKHMPSRLVPLKRYSIASSIANSGLSLSEALHMSELQKAIVNVSEKVLNLQEIAHNFCVSRSLTKYGQIQDLSAETLSVRIDYLNGAHQKIFNNYVVGLRRITISSDGVMASF